LLKLWAFGFFFLHIGWLIHILPAVAVFAILLGLLNYKHLIRLENLIILKS
jgi:hypothetical protein